MRVKIILLFLFTVLTPTAFLAYFGLLSVQSEKTIVEKNLFKKYASMADIVVGEINTAIQGIPEKLLQDPQVVTPILLKNTLLFKDEVMIFDETGRAVDGQRFEKNFGSPAYVAKIAKLPYRIAVYERYPQIANQLKEIEYKKKNIYSYITLIGFAAISILAGGFFTLMALSKEWRTAQLKSEFVSHLAHDLRRPLTSIRMFSEMLDMGHIPSEEKRKEYYGIIARECEQLTHLANNVLDFSRLENRQKEYNFKPESLSQIVLQTVDRFKNYISDEERKIVVEIKNPVPPIPMDAEALSQAIINLLFNAVRYSPPNSEIKVELLREGKDAFIKVIDKGIGIPKEEQKKIFEKYFRSNRQEVKNREGSGLGLTLVKHALMAHKGKIEVESEEGKGSIFSIRLPLRGAKA